MPAIVQVALRGSRREFFVNTRDLWLRVRDRVIVQGEHGETPGTVLLTDPTLVELKRPGPVTREVIRKAGEEDLDQEDKNARLEDEAFEFCARRIEARDLKMELSEVEAAFRRNRITFFFTAEHRVDFRELVKDLASRFQTRIELRQIGVRDQAKRIDGCGPCGREFCCSSWMKGFHPVTLKMAREQQLSLNPTKISGACGRLMCCLSYELAQYRDSAQRLPPAGTRFSTGQGMMTVTRTETYQEVVWVRDDEGGEHRIAYADMPPGPYHQCGDCGCGKKAKPSGEGGDEPRGGGAPRGGGEPRGGDGRGGRGGRSGGRRGGPRGKGGGGPREKGGGGGAGGSGGAGGGGAGGDAGGGPAGPAPEGA